MYEPEEFARTFKKHTGRHDGLQVVASLRSGLGVLSNLLYLRLHQDVQKVLGIDSAFVPVSETRTHLHTQVEIGLYQVAESAATIRHLGYWSANDHGYVPGLAKLILAENPLSRPHRQRIKEYLS